MEIKQASMISLLALAVAGCAQTGSAPNSVSSLAGVYSSAHPITFKTGKLLTNGYVEIDHDGRITAFERKGEGPASIGSGCYVLAAGTATNAGLQGRTLTLGVSARGDTVYQTIAGDDDTFGILVKRNATEGMRWFFNWGKQNSTVTINGSHNVISSSNQSTYSITGPALTSPTPEQLRGMLCGADVISEAAR
ncbi:hypothetical protein [Paraburkholderia sp. BL21I4N1]|uniref:hypothetical protein n=1 Tax=Paraburkholderia sp. BL21I4N1 TaxID=1938801 RepID=UPI000D40E420|nr:hypothetical protein [Paraburkholderia sp. BL21I4N1]PQV51959.1 hypothetical protein B0G83_104169 [Paraburkholderia sp. BL21I4N1]